jgi:hypothetical protein
MGRAARGRRGARIALAVAVGAWASPATADDKADCISAAESAQNERLSSKLLDAEAHLRTCARDVCPKLVRDDCQKWLPQVEQSLPTIVLRAHDPKRIALTDVTASIDGVPVATRLDDRPIPLDPGSHTVRFARTGSPLVEQTIIVSTGEKGRAVDVQLLVPTARDQPSAAGPRRPIPVGVFVLAGVGVLALGSFTYFAIAGTSDVDQLRSTCGLYCSSSDVSNAHTQLLVADISLGVSVVSLGAAAWLFFRRPEAPAPNAASLDVQPIPGGALARVGGSF